jgi:penicillin-binding protein 1A
MRRITRIKSKPLFLWLAGILVAAGLFLGYLVILSRGLPPIDQLTNLQASQSTKIFDRTGEKLLYEIYDEEKRTIVPAEDIPGIAREAMVAVEDEHFYSHPAFDPRGIIRAFLVDLIQGRAAQGASTITQQLARNAFLTPKRSCLLLHISEPTRPY